MVADFCFLNGKAMFIVRNLEGLLLVIIVDRLNCSASRTCPPNSRNFYNVLAISITTLKLLENSS